MNRATPWIYTMKIFRVSAATVKNAEPMKKIWITTTKRKGCRKFQRWLGPIRVWSAQGAKVPSHAPSTRPENAKTVVTNEPAQRPPRYANFEMGLVNKIW